MSPCSIFDMPQEIAELALVFSSPSDVASFAQTCRSARRIVYGNDQHIWRRLYLHQPFDDPRQSPKLADADPSSVEWMSLLQRRWKAMRLIQSVDKQDLGYALAELVHVVRFAAPMHTSLPISQDLSWVSQLLKQSGILTLSDPWSSRAQHWQQTAQLWCLLGWREEVLNSGNRSLQSYRNLARAFVYDLRNYTKKTHWGPYLPSSDCNIHVDWWHVQNMIVVIQNNLMDLSDLWNDSRPPLTLDSVRAYSAPGTQTRDPRDWAGVEGTWRRFVCFMDYRDLFSKHVFPLIQVTGSAQLISNRPALRTTSTPLREKTAFNFATDSAYNTAIFDDEEFQEATRLIEITLKITRVKDNGLVPSYPGSPASSASTPRDSASPVPSSASSSFSSVSLPPSQGPSMVNATGFLISEAATRSRKYPDIYFVGLSRGGNGNESKLRGVVQMTADGNVRWRFYSIYEGVKQWGSEGVQIGNVCSAAGIVGSWTSVEHEDTDPAGPFWMWKVSEDHPSYLHHSSN